ncbi:MAG: hypothetical protein ACR2Q3_01970, partial [Woeseiaceae bacterium]
MDSEKLNDWMQVIGIFALVASLVFVGLQIRQTHEIAVSQAFQARAQTSAEAFLAFSENERLASVATKIRMGKSTEITEIEKTSLGYAMLAGMYLWENGYYQFQGGFASQDHWDRTVVGMKLFLASPVRRSMVKSFLDQMRPEFAAELS